MKPLVRALLLCAALVAASPAARAEDPVLPPGVVARVHGEDITQAQLWDRLALRFEGGDKGREVLDQIVDDTAVAIEAKARGVSVSDAELAEHEKKLQQVVKQQSGGQKTLDDVLRDTKTTRAEFERTAREFIVRQKMAQADLGAKPGEDLPDHRLKLWVSSIKRKLVVRWKDLPEGVLAQVGTVTIDRQRFARELAQQLPRESVAGVRADLVLDAATRHAVAKAGVTVTEEDISRRMAWLRRRFETPQIQASGITFDAYLRQAFGKGEADLRQDPTFRARVALERMLARDIGEEQVRKYWEANRALYGERAMLRQIYIPATDDTARYDGKAKVLSFAQAREIALRAKVAVLERAGMIGSAAEGVKRKPLPEILAEVAKEPEFTVDADARAQAGERVLWSRLDVEGKKELADAVFVSEMGSVVGPIRSDIGYHVLIVEERRPAPPYEEAKDNVRDDLLRVAVRHFALALRVDDQVIVPKDE